MGKAGRTRAAVVVFCLLAALAPTSCAMAADKPTAEPLVLTEIGAAEMTAAMPHATRHLRIVTQLLASNRLHGRDNDTDESRLAQSILVRLLRRFGEGLNRDASGDAAYQQPFVLNGNAGTNLVAIIRGSELPQEYVFLGAHYDHLGKRSRADGACAARSPIGTVTCNGATDNATGVAAVLGIAEGLRALPHPPRRSVILALWDAEEDGLVGSRYYVAHPLVPHADTVAYLNFDIQGQNLLPSLAGTTFVVGSETGGGELQTVIDLAAAAEELHVHPVSYLLGQERSDYKNFVDKKVPTAFFSDSTGPCYHTTGDDLSIVDFAKLRAQVRIAFRVTVALAEATTRPPFAGKGPLPAVYADAVALDQVFRSAQPDLGLFTPTDQVLFGQLAGRMAQLVADGASQFDANDVIPLLGDTSTAIELLRRVECRPWRRR